MRLPPPANGATAQVVLRNVAKSYGGLPILERVSLDVVSGSFCTIVGTSGCGKSTFLRMLLSQETPSSGTITLEGKPLPPEPTTDRGIVFQRYSVFPHLSVEDNLVLADEFVCAPFTGKFFGAALKIARDRHTELLEKIGLATARKRYPDQLSGGMQQRLAIAQALVMKPKILLLDEPFGALDPGIRSDMQDLLTQIWEETKMTIFMVTHDIHEAFRLGTRMLVFDKVRHDPDQPEAYGATITYDLTLDRKRDQRPPKASELFPVPPNQAN
jgi:NitT/TauT family transport system ATP-binding protein